MVGDSSQQDWMLNVFFIIIFLSLPRQRSNKGHKNKKKNHFFPS